MKLVVPNTDESLKGSVPNVLSATSPRCRVCLIGNGKAYAGRSGGRRFRFDLYTSEAKSAWQRNVAGQAWSRVPERVAIMVMPGRGARLDGPP